MPTLLLLAALSLQAQSTVRISGSVTDETALPLPGAVIELNGRVVAISDERGSFELAATLETLARIRIALDGFEPYEASLDTGIARLDVVLAVRRFEDRVRVTVRPPRPPVDPVYTRQPIDVYRTPGAQGDLFRALQTLPGVTATDDAAGLFVRCGDVSEVIVSLDDAVMSHPYRCETPTGGVRGAVNRTFTGLLFAVNGTPRPFEPPPEGWDGSAGIGWDLQGAGRVRTFVLMQRDAVGVEAERNAFGRRSRRPGAAVRR